MILSMFRLLAVRTLFWLQVKAQLLLKVPLEQAVILLVL